MKLFMRPKGQLYSCSLNPYDFKINHLLNWGMPSGHMQIATLFSTIICYYILFEKNHKTIYDYLTIISIIIITLLIGYSRIYLLCHTYLQIFIGGIIGFILGIFFWRIIKIYNI